MKYQKLYDIIYWSKRNGDTADQIYKKIIRCYDLTEKEKTTKVKPEGQEFKSKEEIIKK